MDRSLTRPRRRRSVLQRLLAFQGCSPKKKWGGRLKQDLDKDLQLHRILILLY